MAVFSNEMRTFLQSEAAKETYFQAQERFMKRLEKEGWKVKRNLKFPRADSPHGDDVLWFKKQAIYLGGGLSPSMNTALSLHLGDIRGLSDDVFMRVLDAAMKRGL